MEKINKDNRKKILGSKMLFEDCVALYDNVELKKGTTEFDTLLGEKNLVIHLIQQPNGLEIKLAKTFQSSIYGIKNSEISNIIISNPNQPQLTISLDNDINIEFLIRKAKFEKVFNFFHNYYSQFISIESNEKSSFLQNFPFLKNINKKIYSDRLSRLDFAGLWITLTLVLTLIVLNVPNSFGFLSFTMVTATLIQLHLGAKRFHDLNKPSSETFKLLIPFFNLYILGILIFRKGDQGKNKYGVNPNYNEKLFN